MSTDHTDALRRIKALVCGEKKPRWDGEWATTQTRGLIADICDVALASTTVAPADERQSMSLLMRRARWQEAPVKTEWGEGMMVADVAITKDETLTIFAHKSAIQKPQADKRAGFELMPVDLVMEFAEEYGKCWAKAVETKEALALQHLNDARHTLLGAIERHMRATWDAWQETRASLDQPHSGETPHGSLQNRS